MRLSKPELLRQTDCLLGNTVCVTHVGIHFLVARMSPNSSVNMHWRGTIDDKAWIVQVLTG